VSGLRTILIASLLLSGCSMAPHYARPAAAIPPSFKEEPGWRQAVPADAIAKGQWWLLFGDPVLSDLEDRVAKSNQNVAAAAAAYDRARATTRELRASLFPQVTLGASGTAAGSFQKGATTTISNGAAGGTNVTSSVGGSGSRRYTTTLGATWEPDLFGRISSGVGQQKALTEASLGDLNNAILAAQGELALNYVQLRGLDAGKAILDATIASYDKNLTITTNRYNAGVVAKVDVLQAQTQLISARATATDLDRQRAILEHAIAVLVGENPSTFALASTPWNRAVPQVPGIVPAALLERRPDVAAAERRVAAANQAIGIERAAFFPTIDLSGNLGTSVSSLSKVLDVSTSVWSLGLRGALTLLDFGARRARVAEARASYEQAVAQYRQTVLTAFQDVEDGLAANRVLAAVGQQRTEAATAAIQVERLTQNQYLAGQIAYSDVIVAQATAFAARRDDVQAMVDRQTAAISLIQAIGGSWTEPALAEHRGQ